MLLRLTSFLLNSFRLYYRCCHSTFHYLTKRDRKQSTGADLRTSTTGRRERVPLEHSNKLRHTTCNYRCNIKLVVYCNYKMIQYKENHLPCHRLAVPNSWKMRIDNNCILMLNSRVSSYLKPLATGATFQTSTDPEELNCPRTISRKQSGLPIIIRTIK